MSKELERERMSSIPAAMTVSWHPSFLRGIARILDFGGTINFEHRHAHVDPVEMDYLSLSRDWSAIGDDLRLAMRVVDAKQPKPNERR